MKVALVNDAGSFLLKRESNALTPILFKLVR